MRLPTLVIHGGAGRALSGGGREKKVRHSLQVILDELWEQLVGGATALGIARRGCEALEDCEHFNAGLGSAIQSDGQIRMSASLMDGERAAFSGIINVERVQNPISLAAVLQEERDRVLDGRGGELLARELEIAPFDPVVPRRFHEWYEQMNREQTRDQADVTAGDADGAQKEPGMGTVGVTVCDQDGQLAASTSTGGRGFERVGRVSDSATVAGNYATARGAVSCTGIGEDITDEALAARIVVRMEDGMELRDAVDRCIREAEQRSRRLAAIAVDDQGRMGWAKTTEVLLAVGRNQKQGTRWAF